MASRVSAGLLMYRIRAGVPEVLLAHPGGPYWKRKDAGAWTIPKGEVAEGESALATAVREFAEETGIATGLENLVPLRPVRQKGGKLVHAWAFCGDCDPATLKSNTFLMEWPPRSGKQQPFPEIDRMAFFRLDVAREKINPAQRDFIDQLTASALLDTGGRP